MTIKRRSILPDPDTIASTALDEPSDARSPDLQGQRLDVYQFVQRNNLCTREDVARGMGLKSSTATARIKELIDMGYIKEPAGMRKTNNSGVRAKCLMSTDRLMSGRVNDKIRVEVILTIDSNGRYGATAKVVGGYRQRGRVTPIVRKLVRITAPPTAAIADAVSPDKLKPMGGVTVDLMSGQIVDAEYEIVPS